MLPEPARPAALWAALLQAVACGGGEQVVFLTADKGDDVTLDAPLSAPAGATYEWIVESTPPGLPPSLSPAGRTATFRSGDHAGTAEVIRREQSGDILFATRFVITVENLPPVAGEITTTFPLVDTDITVSSTSSDPDGESLTYRWTLSEEPAAAAATIGESSSLTTTLHTDTEGRYQVTLTVEDGDGARDTATLDFDVYGPLTPDTVIGGFDDPLSRPALSASRDELVFAGAGLHIFDLVAGTVAIDDTITAVDFVDGTPSGRHVWLRRSASVRLYDLAARDVVFNSATATENVCRSTDDALYWTTSTTAGSRLHALFWQSGLERLSDPMDGILSSPALSPSLERVFVAEHSFVAPHRYSQFALDAPPALLESGETAIDWSEAGRLIDTFATGDRFITHRGNVYQFSIDAPPAFVATAPLIDADSGVLDFAHHEAAGLFAIGASQHVRLYDDRTYQLARDFDLTFWTNPEQPIWVYAYRDGFLVAALEEYTLRTLYMPAP